MGDEKRIVEDYLTKQVEKRGGLCVKFVPDHYAGFPDRIVLNMRGQTVYVECKAPHVKGVDKLQAIVHGRLRSRGHAVEVLRNRQEVDYFITAWFG